MSASPASLPPELLLEALGLKDVDRAGWLRVGVPRPESVAAHSWGIALLALALCPAHLDRERVLALAILHDLPEVRTGDLTPHDPVSPEEKARREDEAARALLGARPDLLALWREYEDEQTPESRFVHALDKLDMALQALRYADLGADTREFLASARRKLPLELLSLLDGLQR